MFVDHDTAFSEIARVLKKGGNYGGLEFCWKKPPTSQLEKDTYAICGCSTLRFFDSAEWHKKLKSALPEKAPLTEYDFDLLSVRGFLRDEGLANSMKIGYKLLRNPTAIKRMTEIWNHFASHSDYFSCVVMAGHKA